jgi:PAS domain S-box-containing protein
MFKSMRPALLAFLLMLGILSDAHAHPNKRVLILNSYHQGYKWTDDEIQGVITSLEGVKDNVKVYIEYMGTKWSSHTQYFEQLRDTYKHKFRNIHFDVVIATDNDAFDFLRSYRDEVFGKVPSVFCGVNHFKTEDLIGHELFTGLNETADYKAGIDLILRLHPATKRIVMITDTSITGRRVHEEFMAVVPDYEKRLKFEFLEDMDMGKLLSRVADLPPESVIFYTFFLKDKAGNIFEYHESVSMVSRAARVPIYGSWDFNLGYGIIGGKLTNGFDQGRVAAELTTRILDRERVQDIPVVMTSPSRYMFDYNQVKRFGIKLSDLPEGSTIINKPPSFYAVNKGLVWGLIAGMAGLILIVAVLLANIYRRKWAEEALQQVNQTLELRVRERTAELIESNEALRRREQEFQALADNSPDVIARLDKELRHIFVNPEAQRLTGMSPQEMVGKTVRELGYPQDPYLAFEKTCNTVLETGRGVEFEFDVPALTGLMHCESRIIPEFAGDGFVESLMVITRDITERRRAEQALRESEKQLRLLSCRLLRAQEEERKSIARDLHDSIGSSLSAVKFCVEQLMSRAKEEWINPEPLKNLVSLVQGSIDEVRRIMTDLRPPLLDDLGILVTIGWFCRHFRAIYSGICLEEDVGVEEGEVPEQLKIVIYRIIQEALNNVAKYSQAKLVTLSLAKRDSTIELKIQDDGVGFDSKSAAGGDNNKKGLGLTSMEERAQLSGGSFTVESRVGKGTTIRALWSYEG